MWLCLKGKLHIIKLFWLRSSKILKIWYTIIQNGSKIQNRPETLKLAIFLMVSYMIPLAEDETQA